MSLGNIQEGFSGNWFYFSKPCKYNFKFSNQIDILSNQYNLSKGWNFLIINPLYAGKSLNNIKGTCNFKKVFYWDSENQKWESMLKLLDDKNILENQVGIGGGLIVSVSDNCKLSLSGEFEISPPGLPNDEPVQTNWIRPACAINNPFGCQDCEVNNTGVFLMLTNGQGESIKVNSVAVTGCTTNNNGGTGWVLPASGVAQYIALTGCSITSGSEFNGNIVVSYRKVSGGTFDQSAAGSIVTKVK
jgi:hypothetical protein